MASLEVVYDACVLYPAALRDLLLRLAAARLCQAKWTEEILDEAFESLLKKRPDLDRRKLLVTRRRMCEAVPDCLVEGHGDRIPSLELPDPGDRHVLAAAIHCGARVIVTDNVKDFPAEALKAWGIVALSADDFVLKILDVAPGRVAEIVRQQAAALRNPPTDVDRLLSKLARQGLRRSAERLHAALP